MLHIAYYPLYAHPLPEGHRFPMGKYELIPGQLMYEGVITAENLFAPEPVSEDVLLLTHDAGYWHRMKHLQLTDKEMRAIGFPQSAQLVEREVRIAQGTIGCALYAQRYGVALNVAGGTHHAFADHGEGFCLLNDFAVAANYLLHRGVAERLLIIDLDVHQGNGTAKLFEQEPRVFTFSMHGRHNYPFHKETSDWDISLEDGTGDEVYLPVLRESLPVLLDRVKPQLVFYLSGVDILASDQFGKLQLSLAGCRQRDEMVFTALHQKNIPCVTAMGGGYSKDIRVIVEAHCQTFRTAKEVYGL